MSDNCRFDWPRRRVAGRAAAVAAITTTIAALAMGCGTTVPPHAAPTTPVQPMRVTSAQIARLPAATTYGTTPAAPPDLAPFAAETGTVLPPEATRVVSARPGGPPVAAL